MMLAHRATTQKALEYYERALAGRSARPGGAQGAQGPGGRDARSRAAGSRASSTAASRSRTRTRRATLERAQRLHLSEDELRAELRAARGALRRAARRPRAHARAGRGARAPARTPRRPSSWSSARSRTARTPSSSSRRAGDLRAKVLKKAIAQADKAGDGREAGALERELIALRGRGLPPARRAAPRRRGPAPAARRSA